MTIAEILLLATALSIDACVVSFSQGLVFKTDRIKNSLILAFFVGFFQFLMPVTGGECVSFVQKIIEPFATFIVFLIYTFLGIKFIKDAFAKESESNEEISG